RELEGGRVAEGDRPGEVAAAAVAAAGHQASDATDRLAEGQGRGREVRNLSEGQAITAHIDQARHRGEGEPAVENARRAQIPQDLDRVCDVVAGIDDVQRQLRADEAGQERHDPEVHDAGAADAVATR